MTKTLEKSEVILSKLVEIIESEMGSNKTKNNQSTDTEFYEEVPMNVDETADDLYTGADDSTTAATEDTTTATEEYLTDTPEENSSDTPKEFFLDDFYTEQTEDESMFNMSNVDTLNQDESLSCRISFDWILLLVCVIGVFKMN